MPANGEDNIKEPPINPAETDNASENDDTSDLAYGETDGNVSASQEAWEGQGNQYPSDFRDRNFIHPIQVLSEAYEAQKLGMEFAEPKYIEAIKRADAVDQEMVSAYSKAFDQQIVPLQAMIANDSSGSLIRERKQCADLLLKQESLFQLSIAPATTRINYGLASIASGDAEKGNRFIAEALQNYPELKNYLQAYIKDAQEKRFRNLAKQTDVNPNPDLPNPEVPPAEIPNPEVPIVTPDKPVAVDKPVRPNPIDHVYRIPYPANDLAAKAKAYREYVRTFDVPNQQLPDYQPVIAPNDPVKPDDTVPVKPADQKPIIETPPTPSNTVDPDASVGDLIKPKTDSIDEKSDDDKSTVKQVIENPWVQFATAMAAIAAAAEGVRRYVNNRGAIEDPINGVVNRAQVETRSNIEKPQIIVKDPVTGKDLKIESFDGKNFKTEEGKIVPAKDANYTLAIPDKKSDGTLLTENERKQQAAKLRCELNLLLKGQHQNAPLLDSISVAADTNLKGSESKLVHIDEASKAELPVVGITEDGKIKVKIGDTESEVPAGEAKLVVKVSSNAYDKAQKNGNLEILGMQKLTEAIAPPMTREEILQQQVADLQEQNIELKEELQKQEQRGNEAARAVEELQRQANELERELELAKADDASDKDEIAKRQTEIEGQKEALKKLADELTATQEQNVKTTSQLDDVNRKLAEAQANDTKDAKAISNLQKEQQRLQDQLAQAAQEREVKHQEIEKFKVQLAEAKANAATDALKIDALTKQVGELQTQVAEILTAREQAEQSIKDQQAKLVTQAEEIEQVKTQLETSRQELADNKTASEQERQQHQEAINELDTKYKAAVAAQEESENKLRLEIQARQEAAQSLQQTQAALAQAQEQLSTAGEEIRTLKEQLTSTHGRVGELEIAKRESDQRIAEQSRLLVEKTEALSNVETELETARRDIQDKTQIEQNQTDKIAELEARKREAETAWRTVSQALTTEAEARTRISQELDGARQQLVQTQQNLSTAQQSFDEQRNRLQAEITELNNQVTKSQEALTKSNEALEAEAERHAATTEELERAKADFASAQEQIAADAQQKQALQDTIDKLTQDLEQANKDKTNAESKTADVQTKLNEAKSTLENLRTEYGKAKTALEEAKQAYANLDSTRQQEIRDAAERLQKLSRDYDALSRAHIDATENLIQSQRERNVSLAELEQAKQELVRINEAMKLEGEKSAAEKAQMNEEIARLNAEAQQASEYLTQADAKLVRAAAQTQQLQQALASTQTMLTEAIRDIELKEASIESLETQIKELNEKMTEAQAARTAADERAQELDNKLKAQTQDINQTKEDLASAKAELELARQVLAGKVDVEEKLASTEARINELETKLSTVEAEKQQSEKLLASEQTAKKEIIARLEEAKTSLQQSQTNLAQAQAQATQDKAALEKLQTEIQDSASKIERLTNELKQNETRLNGEIARNAKTGEELATARENLAKAQADIAALKDNLAKTQSELEQAREIPVRSKGAQIQLAKDGPVWEVLAADSNNPNGLAVLLKQEPSDGRQKLQTIDVAKLKNEYGSVTFEKADGSSETLYFKNNTSGPDKTLYRLAEPMAEGAQEATLETIGNGKVVKLSTVVSNKTYADRIAEAEATQGKTGESAKSTIITNLDITDNTLPDHLAQELAQKMAPEELKPRELKIDAVSGDVKQAIVSLLESKTSALEADPENAQLKADVKALEQLEKQYARDKAVMRALNTQLASQHASPATSHVALPSANLSIVGDVLPDLLAGDGEIVLAGELKVLAANFELTEEARAGMADVVSAQEEELRSARSREGTVDSKISKLNNNIDQLRRQRDQKGPEMAEDFDNRIAGKERERQNFIAEKQELEAKIAQLESEIVIRRTVLAEFESNREFRVAAAEAAGAEIARVEAEGVDAKKGEKEPGKGKPGSGKPGSHGASRAILGGILLAIGMKLLKEEKQAGPITTIPYEY
jgi:chromosome segregation ATPase